MIHVFSFNLRGANMNQQEATARCRGLMDAGMSVADANVEMVRMMGLREVKGRLPQALRAAYMAAVKDGRLGRLPKNGLKPEFFFHPNSIWEAKAARNKALKSAMEAILSVCTGP
jgi:uncharacterized protein YoaH (UPF0181 family)